MDIERLFGREILSRSLARQNKLIVYARDYWRESGFPFPSVTSAEVRRELDNLVASDNLINGYAHGLLSTVGLRIANVCQPQIWRIKVRGKSCIDIFTDDDRLMRALSKAPAFWPNRRCWNAQSIRSLMRISHKMRPSNFRPVVARQLIRSFSRDGDCVLDFSAGFGGRLLGAVSLKRHYVGIDPARAQILGLRRLYKRIAAFSPGTVELYGACAEDLLPDFQSRSVSLVISSPPYFDKERYSVEPTQSYLRYPLVQDWVNRFLRPTLHHSARILKPRGIMLLNVTDSPEFNLMKLAIDACKNHLMLLGWIPYPMRSNPVGHERDVLKREPILVFQKAPIDHEVVVHRIRMFKGHVRAMH